MSNFIIYTESTGDIVKSVTCPDDMLSLQVGGGEAAIEGTANDYSQKVIDGAVFDKDTTNEDNEKKIQMMRAQRGSLLAGSDWTQFSDSPLTSTKKSQWATYRQALRDLPQSHSKAESLDDIIWPIQPE